MQPPSEEENRKAAFGCLWLLALFLFAVLIIRFFIGNYLNELTQSTKQVPFPINNTSLENNYPNSLIEKKAFESLKSNQEEENSKIKKKTQQDPILELIPKEK